MQPEACRGRNIDCCSIVLMQDAGHYAFLDQPQVFLDNLHRICTNYLRSGTPQVCCRGHVSSRFAP